jgi:cation-transporting ATPase E
MSMKANQRFFPDTETGLTKEQVEQRIHEGLINTPVEPPSKTVPDIIKSNVFTYFNLVFAVIAVLLIIAGSFRDLTFLPIVIANTVIGIVQEIRSKNVLDKLTVLNAPKSRVIRDGSEMVIPSSELVLDDMVIFAAGNQIPADAEVVDGQIQVNESLITGEADEITKEPGSPLLSGSFVVSGKCYAQLDEVGEDSYISQLTLEAKKGKPKEQTEMIRSLDKIVLVAGILIIPIGIVLFSQQYFLSGETFRSSVTSMVAAIIGMIPEGLYLLASVALVVSVMRLAGKKVLVHDMKCIEMLARVDTLCVDKTGTITENEMTVDDILPFDSGKASRQDCEKRLSDFVSNMEADNSTMKTLKKYFRPERTATAEAVTPFSSAYKYSSVSFEDGAYVLGAPEFVLGDDYEEYEEQVAGYSSKGYRVLIFGEYSENPQGQALTGDFTPWCLLLLSNQIREEAPETFRYFAEQDVCIKVISGDNPMTVSEVAQKAGIVNADKYIDARMLESSEDIAMAVRQFTVFGRVTPDQKRKFVRALQADGHTVAMTGDGVNDVLALKDADCSIAMASGSDAAAQASDLVLLDSRFSSMPSVVAEGRRVVNNITRSASLFLVKNIFSLLLAIFSMVIVLDYPLEPSQVSLISMFTIGVPGFFLAMQPNKNRIEGHFISNVLVSALPAGLTDAVAVGALVIFGNTFGVDATDLSTAATLLLAIVGLMILYRVSKPLNLLRGAVLICSAVGMLFCIFFISDLFAITGISLRCGMLLGVFAVCTEPMLRYSSIVVKRISIFIRKLWDGAQYVKSKEYK